ncbi:MAG: hypothetical protein HUK40_11575 [Desulfobacter sp.]|nr:hypothetical protein [Desulfobacter sp.]WDP84461.1 MAG: hypothetical protein HUN05_04275 [Desulfobacter sp.]
MTRGLPQYPKTEDKNWKTLDITDQYAQFDRLLIQARKKSLFETLPDSPAAAMTREFKKHGQAMAKQLWLLGYLEAEDKHQARKAFHRDRKNFLNSAARFQKEAGLKPDRWTGKKTRAALTALVSFETDHLDKRWLDAPHEYPAVMRAAQCRLFVLGLAAERPGKSFSLIAVNDLNKFKRLAMALGMVTLEQDQIRHFMDTRTPSPALLGLILDQDCLIKAVARSCRPGACGLEFNIPSRKSHGRHLPQAYQIRRFLTRLVQVEFWLMGYQIPLAQMLEYPVKGIDTKNDQDCNPELKTCLADFAGLAQKAKKTWAREITPELFTAFDDAYENQDDEKVLSQINSRLQRPREIERALEQGKKLHLRLWDGIKRVLR